MEHLILRVLSFVFVVLLVVQFIARKGDRPHIWRASALVVIAFGLFAPVIHLFSEGRVVWNPWLVVHITVASAFTVSLLSTAVWGVFILITPVPTFLNLAQWRESTKKRTVYERRHKTGVRWIKLLVVPTIVLAIIAGRMS